MMGILLVEIELHLCQNLNNWVVFVDIKPKLYTYWHHISSFRDCPVEPKCIAVTSTVELGTYNGIFTVSPIDKSLKDMYQHIKFYNKSGGEVGGNSIPYMSYIRSSKMSKSTFSIEYKIWQKFKGEELRKQENEKDIQDHHNYVNFLVADIANHQPKNDEDDLSAIKYGCIKGAEYTLANSLQEHLDESQFKQLTKYMVNLL